MKRILIVLIALTLINCKQSVKKTIDVSEESEKEKVEKFEEGSPASNIHSVIEGHGGLDTWQSKRTMAFTMPKAKNAETHTIDLYSRNATIESAQFQMGYNGANYWLADENENYKGDPIFYHNLMFYFYAMPFVLADNGIIYSETEDLVYEGKSYPGVRISYEDGVGVSSKDEYFVHYDSKTNQMTWLGYTVTYRSGEKSEKIKWIRYDDWQEVEGLTLPKSITWYKVEDGIIMEAASTRAFENIVVSEIANPLDFYNIPENGSIVTKQ